METICCTGHRPQFLPHQFGYDYTNEVWSRVIKETKKIIKTLNPQVCITGMALGYDLAFAIAVLQLQNEGYNIKLHAALATPNQTKYWEEASKQLFADIIGRCEEVHRCWIPPHQERYVWRDKWMVDHSQSVVAFYDGRNGGGTHYTVQYAIKNDIDVFVIDPGDYI